jgi:23S rRNA C2498 (ribose-2'-O)-methylase RlmM
VKVSQYTFAMCTYLEKKSEPKDMLQLDGFTVDYCTNPGGKYSFVTKQLFVYEIFSGNMNDKGV